MPARDLDRQVDKRKVLTPTLFFSAEMSHAELIQRIIAAEGTVDNQRLRGGGMGADEFQKVTRVLSRLQHSALYIDDYTTKISELLAAARRWHGREVRRKDLDRALIVVDYLQLFQPSRQHGTREQEVAEISAGLKRMAKTLDCPVIAVAQLNRAVEQRTPPRPRLSDLRDSGAIEQDADAVMFLYRPEFYATPEDIEHDDLRGKAELILAKQRQGPVGTIHLHWSPAYTRFHNAARGE